MEENKAQTTETWEQELLSSDGVNADTVTSEGAAQTADELTNVSAFSSGAADGEENGNRSGDEPKGKQTREQNRENARQRREREKLIRQTREKTIIEALDGRNPYTGEEMKDSLDVEEYLAMKEIEKSGGDPVVDYAKFSKNRVRMKEAAARDRAAREEWFQHDREAFLERHPDVKLEELIADEQFRAYAEGKAGRVPLSEIYEGFVGMVGEYEERAKKMAAQLLANQNASPGSLRTSQHAQSDFFTRDEVRKMTPAEVRANYEKIRNSMMKWK